MTTGPTIEPLTLQTDDGVRLEAELSVPGRAQAVAVVAHPHPLYGGNMYNNVVSGLFGQLPRTGVTCLRFNFRGVGGSEGRHSEGSDEPADIVAAVDAMSERFPDLPVVCAGYSFGADVSLSVADDRLSGWFAVAPPLRVVPIQDMTAGHDRRPKRIISGTADEFRPPDQVKNLVADWPNCSVAEVEGATHFFTTGLDSVVASASDFLSSITG